MTISIELQALSQSAVPAWSPTKTLAATLPISPARINNGRSAGACRSSTATASPLASHTEAMRPVLRVRLIPPHASRKMAMANSSAASADRHDGRARRAPEDTPRLIFSPIMAVSHPAEQFLLLQGWDHRGGETVSFRSLVSLTRRMFHRVSGRGNSLLRTGRSIQSTNGRGPKPIKLLFGCNRTGGYAVRYYSARASRAKASMSFSS